MCWYNVAVSSISPCNRNRVSSPWISVGARDTALGPSSIVHLLFLFRLRQLRREREAERRREEHREKGEQMRQALERRTRVEEEK